MASLHPLQDSPPVLPTIESGAALQFVTIDIHGHSHALPIEAVIEFRMWIEPTPLPHSPYHLLGIINIRGEIVPVFDVGARLGYGRAQPTAQHVITLVQIPGDKVVGLLVNDVSDVLTVTEISSLPSCDAGLSTPVVDSVIEIGDTVLGIINVDVLCNSETPDELLAFKHPAFPPPRHDAF
ncbi:MAG: chemotaxis protein CheW [Rhodospirillaceae bacterium]